MRQWSDWNGPEILGESKTRLLKEVVLPALGVNRSLQRLVDEYTYILDEALLCSLPQSSGALVPPSNATHGGGNGTCTGALPSGEGAGRKKDVPEIAGGASSSVPPAGALPQSQNAPGTSNPTIGSAPGTIDLTPELGARAGGGPSGNGSEHNGAC
ncbi:unnamed protein product [Discosporangium mesarthrocarpum]